MRVPLGGARRGHSPSAQGAPTELPDHGVGRGAHHVRLPLCVCLLDPAQLRQGEDGGDGAGERQLVVAARGPLELQACGGGEGRGSSKCKGPEVRLCLVC